MIGEALRRFEPSVEIQPKYIKITDSDKRLIVFEAEGNIFDLRNEVTPFFLKHLLVTSRMEGMYRKDELEVPITALRECCANALAHMDWRKTASVGVVIYDDRIEIENAGMLPEEIPAAKHTYGSHILASHTSEPPNEIIARVMYYSGVIEHWGRGLSMIFEECNRARLPQPTVTNERGIVRVVFMRPNLSGQKYDPINDPIKILSEVEKEALHIVKKHPGISRIKIVPIIGKSEVRVRQR